MDFDPEYAGDEQGVRIQRRIFEQLRWISDTGGMVSRGNRVSYLDASRVSPETAMAIARQLHSVVFFLRPQQVEDFTARFNANGFAVSPFLRFVSADVAFGRCDAITIDNLPPYTD